MESEYTAASTAIQEAFWLKCLLEELGVNIRSLIVMFEDNKACISFSGHPCNHRNSKLIDYREKRGSERDYKASVWANSKDPEKFIKFRDALVVSRSLLKIIKTQK